MTNRITMWLDSHAAPEWRVAHKLWSVRLAVFWGAVNGLYAAWPAFIGAVPPLEFALISVGFAVAIALARFTRQPGADL